MEKEIERFDNLKDLQERAETTKDYLAQMSERYTQRTAAMKEKIAEVSAQYEKNRAKLETNDTWKSLDGLEQKLRHQGQNIFALQEFIEMKGRQSDFEGIKIDCLKMVEELNSIAIEREGA